MKWIDYREKLGIGFDDNAKLNLLKNKIIVFLKTANQKFTIDDIRRYSIMVGEILPSNTVDSLIINLSNEVTTLSFISKCVALLNSYEEHIKYNYNNKPIGTEFKPIFLQFLKKSLENVNIQFCIQEDKNGVFIFPKGAKELDDALVSEPLEWLSDYPKTRKTFINALKQYSDGIYIRDVADNLRKALEAFLQEFLDNGKNLENNKTEICKYLGEQGVDAGISGLFQPLINSYKNINDRMAKHNDAVDEKLLEFLLYQTGLLIRMVITIKNSEEDKNET